MTATAFFDVPQAPHTTTAGEVRLPVLYGDASLFQAFFLADAWAARRALEGTGLEPVVVGPKAIAGLAFLDHRDTSLGPHHEAALGLVVRLAGDRSALRLLAGDLRSVGRQRRLGFHVLHLPVTTAAARAAGGEIWGYPTFLADLPLDFTPGRFRGEVVDPMTGEPSVVLEGRVPAGVPGVGLDVVLYSRRDGAILRTVVDVRARVETSLGRALCLRVGPSAHPMAESVRALGLEGASPLFVQRSLTFQARLQPGVRVG